MPYKRSANRSRVSTTRKSAGRRRYSKRPASRPRRRTARVSRVRLGSTWKNPLALKGSYRFIYNDQAYSSSLTAAGAYQNNWVFSLNDPYDPDVSGVGVQPYGWDTQLGAVDSGLFTNYRVYASKITIYMHQTHGNPVKVLIVPMPVSNGVSSGQWDDIARMPYCKANLLNSSSDQTDTLKVSNYLKSKQIVPLGWDATELQAYYNASPVKRLYWFVSFDGATAAPGADFDVHWDVKITYYTKVWRVGNVDES